MRDVSWSVKQLAERHAEQGGLHESCAAYIVAVGKPDNVGSRLHLVHSESESRMYALSAESARLLSGGPGPIVVFRMVGGELLYEGGYVERSGRVFVPDVGGAVSMIGPGDSRSVGQRINAGYDMLYDDDVDPGTPSRRPTRGEEE